MGNISTLLTVMHKFTPSGQAKIAKFLRKATPELDDINRLSISLRDDVVDIGTSSRDVLADGFDTFVRDNAKKIKTEDFNKLIATTQATVVENINRTTIPKISKILTTKKRALYKFAKNDLGDKNLAQKIQAYKLSGNPEVDNKTISEIWLEIQLKMGQFYVTNYQLIENGSKGFRVLQKNYNEMQIISDRTLEFCKITIPKTKDPKVREMEDFLKQEYKLDYVHLEDAKSAEKIKNCLKIAKGKKLPIPKNIVVTPDVSVNNIKGLNRLGSDLNTTIYIMPNTIEEKIAEHIIKSGQKTPEQILYTAPSFWGYLTHFSTDLPEHFVMHELLHSKNPLLICNKKIPKKYKKVVEKLSDYANDSFNKFNDEVRNELLTKEVLEGLNKEEKELLDFLS